MTPAKKYVIVEVATVNDDFNTPKSNVPAVAKVLSKAVTGKTAIAAFMFIQEAKNETVKHLLGAVWGVLQVMTTKATKGVAVAWFGAGFEPGSGGQKIGVSPGHARMLPRMVTAQRGHVGRRRLLLISTHRPPARYKWLWPAFDAALAARILLARRAGRLIILGMDANQRNPKAVALLCGLRLVQPANKKSIDVFLISKSIVVRKLWRLPTMTSDHHPLLARLAIPA